MIQCIYSKGNEVIKNGNETVNSVHCNEHRQCDFADHQIYRHHQVRKDRRRNRQCGCLWSVHLHCSLDNVRLAPLGKVFDCRRLQLCRCVRGQVLRGKGTKRQTMES